MFLIYDAPELVPYVTYRFLSAKITMDVLVEVTDKFGASAGHFLSTVIAAIVAEPLIIAYVVTGLIVLINLLVMLVRKIRRRHWMPECRGISQSLLI